MNVKGGAVDAFLARPDPKVAVFLLHGPDQGAITGRVAAFVARVADAGDPFAVTDVDAEAFALRPGRLIEEAQTASLLGGRRVVRVRQADKLDGPLREQFAEEVRRLLALPDILALVLVEAGDLKAASALRRMCEKADNAAALPCYREEQGQGLADTIRAELRASGLGVEPDALRLLESSLGGDRGVTKAELRKLALYMAGADTPTVRLEDVRAVVGDSAALDLDAFAWAALGGEFGHARRLLRRLLDEKNSPVALVRVLNALLQRLLPLALKVEAGTSPRAVVEAARPPVFWKLKGPMTKALETWKPPRLVDAVAASAAAERDLKRTGPPDALVLERLLLDVCGMADPRRR
ncbi:MAG: DNA polymerase III subunit delta [Geminicoccaceae bacterium]|nr:DNA polymerase III subunit delta [Geminicoccaceae bacterium]